MRNILFLFTLVILVSVISVNDVFADNQITITPVLGSGAPGCEASGGCYIPNTATVDVGGVVIFSNTDTAAHTFTSGDPTMPETVQGLFDSSLVMTGSTYEWSPTKAGNVPYYCMVHPWMKGIIVVKDSSSPPSSSSGRILVSGTNTHVSYSITGGKLLNIIPDLNAKSLINSIDATKDGTLTLTIPRTVFDSVENGVDVEVFILIDQGEAADFNEITTATDRTITIAFPAGTEEIEIVGTNIPSSYSTSPQIPTTPTPTPTPPRVPSGIDVVVSLGSSVPGCESNSSCYQPYKFTVGKGSTVTWFNADTAAHTVTSGTPSRGSTSTFDSSLFMSGATFSHKFNDDGTYPYYCMVHPWMTGYVIVQRGGSVISPTPVPTPIPTPTPTHVSIFVSTDDTQYSPSDLVTVQVSTSTSANVAVSVMRPTGDSIVSRSVTTDSRGNGSLQFKLPDASPNGTYRVDVTATISGQKITDSASFSVKSSSARTSIVSLQPTDQQGNAVSSFTKGKLGFVKVVLSSDSSVNSLVTINLFDSELTSLGIGSFKTTLGSGQSEMTLSFFIPDDAQFGSADVYANVFSDWPSQGGVPLTGESSTQVRLQ